ncbi:Pentatricopeptide repeat-containing protein At2g41720 (Protein EMBRYO DEFECTIVE 2654), partial [Durusdinium trenchii]
VNVIHFNTAIHACHMCQDSNLATSFLKSMRAVDVNPDTTSFNTAISACEKEWRRALHLLQTMILEELQPDTISYNSVINACEKDGQWQQALHLLFAMKIVQLEPDVISFSSSLSACAKESRWLTALQHLQWMRLAQVIPNVVTLTAAITACEGHLPDMSLALLDMMFQVQIQPNEIAYTSAISACAADDDWWAACSLLEEMNTVALEPGIVSYGAVLKALPGRWLWAAQLLRNANELTIRMNEVACTAAIAATKKTKKWKMVLQTLQDVIGTHLDMDLASMAITCIEDQWQHALRFLGEARPRSLEVDLVAQNAVLSACDQWFKSIQLFNDALPAMGFELDSVSSGSVLTGYARGRNWQRTLHLLAWMRSRSVTDDITCTAAVSACTTGGLWEQALRVLSSARSAAMHRLASLTALHF